MGNDPDKHDLILFSIRTSKVTNQIAKDRPERRTAEAIALREAMYLNELMRAVNATNAHFSKKFFSSFPKQKAP